MTLDVRQVHNTDDAAIAALVAQSDAYLQALYPPESNHAEPLSVLVGDDAAFFVGWLDGKPVACGGLKFVFGDVAYGEIKRVFVDPAERGKRLAVTIMEHLEAVVTARGMRWVRLEAGPKQPEALGLYAKLGYVERGPFGDYQPDPLSVFMEKSLP